jgi:hypothetical protein
MPIHNKMNNLNILNSVLTVILVKEKEYRCEYHLFPIALKLTQLNFTPF